MTSAKFYQYDLFNVTGFGGMPMTTTTTPGFQITVPPADSTANLNPVSHGSGTCIKIYFSCINVTNIFKTEILISLQHYNLEKCQPFNVFNVTAFGAMPMMTMTTAIFQIAGTPVYSSSQIHPAANIASHSAGMTQAVNPHLVQQQTSHTATQGLGSAGTSGVSILSLQFTSGSSQGPVKI